MLPVNDSDLLNLKFAWMDRPADIRRVCYVENGCLAWRSDQGEYGGFNTIRWFRSQFASGTFIEVSSVPDIVVGLRYTHSRNSGRSIQTVFGVNENTVAYAGPDGRGIMDLYEFRSAIAEGSFIVVE